MIDDKPHALGEFALDIGHERAGRLLGRSERRGLAEQQRIGGQQPPGLLIGGAAHHDAVDVGELLLRLLEARDAAIDDDLEIGMRALQPMHQRVVERRHVAVFLRRQSLQPGLARMHDERVGAGGLDRFA